MESRLWNQIQLNEAVTQADHDLSEQRLERSSTEPSSEKSLVLKQTARACHVDKSSYIATTKSNAACKQAEDPFDPVKSPDFSIHSPTMLNLLTRMKPGAQCLPSLGVRQEEPSEMNYEYGDSNYTARSDCESTPRKKRARPFARRNSVVVHRRQGDIASMLQDILRPSIASSPMSDESAMPPIFNRHITESPLIISGIASEVFPSRQGSKKRKTNPDHVSHEESEE